MQDFIIWLNKKIDDSHLSISEFARKAGLSPSGLTNILNGKRNQPDFDTLEKLSIYLNYDIISLLKLSGLNIPEIEESWQRVEDPELRNWLTAENINALPDLARQLIIAVIKVSLEEERNKLIEIAENEGFEDKNDKTLINKSTSQNPKSAVN